MQTQDTRQWKTLGIWGGGFVGFWVMLIANYYLPHEIPFLAPALGLGAWFAIYVKCVKRENIALQSLCNPPEELWPMPLPYAWGTVKEVLSTEGYESKEIGRRTWDNIQEDDSRATMTADLRFTEKYTEPRLTLDINEAVRDRSEMASRGVSITVKFVPDRDTKGTRVTFVYQPHMQKGDDTAVREIIQKMRKKFPERMAINKKELGI